jgi:tight adherence protein B
VVDRGGIVSATVAGALTALAALGGVLAASGARAAISDRRVQARLGATSLPAPSTPAARSLPQSAGKLLRRVVGVTGGDRALPELLGGVARELRSGASLPAALVVAAESIGAHIDPSCAELARTLRHGADLEPALLSWSTQRPGSGRELAATALALGARTGGASALVVDGVADTLRDRLAIEREVAALSSQARASAALLVVAPIVVAVLAAAADPRIASFLVGSPIGWACIVGGLVLDAVGAAWMRAIVAGAR